MVVAAVVAVIAVAISTYMSVRASQQQAALAKSVQEQKDEERKAAVAQAAFDEKQTRRRNALLVAKQEALFGASGLDTTEGTPLFTAIDSAKQSEMDALNVRAYGLRQAAGFKFESNIAKFRRQVALGDIPWEIAQGAASAASSGYSAYQKGSGGGRRTTVSDWTTQ